MTRLIFAMDVIESTVPLHKDYTPVGRWITVRYSLYLYVEFKLLAEHLAVYTVNAMMKATSLSSTSQYALAASCHPELVC